MLRTLLPRMLSACMLGVIFLTACGAPVDLPENGAASNTNGGLSTPTTGVLTASPTLAVTDTPSIPTRTPLPASPYPSAIDTPSGPLIVTVLPSSGGAISGTLVNPQDQVISPTPPPFATDGDNNLVITPANNGSQVMMTVGQRFSLQLGEQYDWQVEIADQAVVSRVIGVMPVRGSQGLFEARQPGTTTLTAVGDPPCRSVQPPCMMPSIQFQIEITVK
jgi:hypothetical protein